MTCWPLPASSSAQKPEATRSGLDRCLRRHGAGNLNALKPAQPAPASKTFKAYEPGYLHLDLKYLPQMQDESSRRYLFVAIDRATRWVFVQIKKNKTAASAKAFLNAVHKACPMRIQKVLTDNGKEFTDRLFASRARQPTGEHEFDQLCASLGIEHRLTKPRTPRTNGMVERFNGRIADVLRSHRFHSAEDLEQTLLRYVALYNHQFPQSALKSRTPLQAMKDWYAKRPDLFVKRPYDHPGCDIYKRAQPGVHGYVQVPGAKHACKGARQSSSGCKKEHRSSRHGALKQEKAGIGRQEARRADGRTVCPRALWPGRARADERTRRKGTAGSGGADFPGCPVPGRPGRRSGAAVCVFRRM